MSPEARVEFLGVDRSTLAARGIRAAPGEVRDIRNPLLLVDDQVVDDVEVLGFRLRKEGSGVLR